MSMFHELMMRKKEQIMYATIKGTLTENDGVFSGFSTSNYFEVQGLYDFSKPFEIKTKIKIGSTPAASSFITVKNSNVGSMIVMVGNGWNIGFYITDSNGNSIVNAGYTPSNILSSNTDCFVKVVFTGTEYACYISTDDTTYTKYSIVTSSRTIGNSCNIKLGANPPNQSFAVGTIDLNKTNIKLGSTKYNLQAVVGYTIVGSPTITDGVVSGFSSGNYLRLTQLPANTQKFEIVVCFESNSTDTPIIATNSLGFIIRQSNNQARVFLASTTSSGWDISNGSRLTALNNAKNWIKIEFTGTQYILSSSNDGINYTIEYTINNSSSIYGLLNSQIRIGQMFLNNQYYNGLIYINETYIKINNKLWFNGQQA